MTVVELVFPGFTGHLLLARKINIINYRFSAKNMKNFRLNRKSNKTDSVVTRSFKSYTCLIARNFENVRISKVMPKYDIPENIEKCENIIHSLCNISIIFDIPVPSSPK